MAYSELTTALTRAGKAVSTTLLNLLRGNFEDHETRLLFLESTQFTVPTGLVSPFGGLAVPSGYLGCDGSVVSRITYADLFVAIGTTFNTGGEAVSDFRLPDTRGKVLMGVGTGATLTARALADAGGLETHTLSAAEMATHTHAPTDPTHSHTWPNVTGAGSPGGHQQTDANATSDHSTDSRTTGISVNNAGSGSAHNNMQPSLVVNFIIKT